MKNSFYIFLLLLSTTVYADKKIVGLVPVRNEALILKPCLIALAQLTDAIVLLDDASEDNTVTVARELAQQCNIERIHEKKIWYRDEPGDRNILLALGREIGGTHFVVIDADEIFTASCIKNNHLRTMILALEPGQTIDAHWIRLWRYPDAFRTDAIIKEFIFCDDGSCFYESGFIHTHRVPKNLNKKGTVSLKPFHQYGLLHMQAANWRNMQIRQAWYRCLYKIRRNDLDAEKINDLCKNAEDESGIRLARCPREWFEYPDVDFSLFARAEQWRENQVLEWFASYGRNYFAGLDIWDIDWGNGLS